MAKQTWRPLLVFVVLLSLSSTLYGQVDSSESNPVADSIVDYVLKNKDRGITEALIIDGDTVPMVILNEILFIPKPSFDNNEARRRYLLLKRKVYRVYPWVVIAATNLDTLNARLNRIPKKRKRKRYIKDFEDYLKDKFEPDLRKLTRSEGQILCKLLYRETDITAYDLVKEYRSGWTAFWYNFSAGFYDISLKKTYDPQNDDEDRLIENILQRAFLQGVLQEREKANIPTPDI
jgi:hypothetical protein